MGEKRAALTAVAAVVGGVLLVAVLVTWAASIGPSGVLTGEGPDAVRITPTETQSSPEEGTPSSGDEKDELARQHAGDRPLLQLIALVLEMLLAVGVLFLLYRTARSAWQSWQARRRRETDPEHVDFDVLDVPQARVVEEITRDADTQRELLLGGSPRNGIVACWHRFEVQAADAGVAPYVWETSSEFTLRFLELAGADPRAVTRLGELYREARFSAHEPDEAARAEAVAVIDTIHHSLLGRTR